MQPFIHKQKGRTFVKLNKELYGKELIQLAKRTEPESVASTTAKGKYHLIELNVDTAGDYLDFLNFLICLKQGQ